MITAINRSSSEGVILLLAFVYNTVILQFDSVVKRNNNAHLSMPITYPCDCTSTDSPGVTLPIVALYWQKYHILLLFFFHYEAGGSISLPGGHLLKHRSHPNQKGRSTVIFQLYCTTAGIGHWKNWTFLEDLFHVSCFIGSMNHVSYLVVLT